ncbi:MAG: OprO/OprP family phosphate-selective porin [Bacteroidetes bacterium]|nr:OprO/OprP family phosphate-selective porin [Bacteroidota bacterium]MBU2584846.1 OprO/OprP family phosphate-selective porin [Bacteroidota bacterium]
MVKKILLSLAIMVLTTSIGNAQEEPLFEKLQKNFQTKYFDVGFLFQGVFDHQFERTFPGNNGFSLANVRVILSGELDEGYGYYLQTNFVSARPLLDARFYYKIAPYLIFDIGQFKVPFGTEYLISKSAIDFVNRAQNVNLIPGRQIGLQVRGDLLKKTLTYKAGVFNGNGTAANANDNRDFMYVGRLEFKNQLSDCGHSKLEVAVNAATTNDAVPAPVFSQKRNFAGGDFRLTLNNLFLSGEFIYQNMKQNNGASLNHKGYHLTAGYMVTDKIQLLGRWDSLIPEKSLFTESNFIVLGCNIWPTKATEFQINYIIDTEQSGVKKHQVLINSQLAF